MFCPFCGASISDADTFCPACGHDLVSEKGQVQTELFADGDAGTVYDPTAGAGRTRYATTVMADPDSLPRPQGVPASAPAPAPNPNPTPAPAPAHYPASNAMPGQGAQNGSYAPSTGLTPSQLREQGLARAQAEGLGMNWYKFLVYFALIAGVVGYALSLLGRVSEFAQMSAYAGTEWYARYAAITIVQMVILVGMGAFNIFTRMQLTRFSTRGPKMVKILYVAILVVNLLLVFGNLPSMIVTAVISGVALALNIVYFNKRAHLFVN